MLEAGHHLVDVGSWSVSPCFPHSVSVCFCGVHELRSNLPQGYEFHGEGGGLGASDDNSFRGAKNHTGCGSIPN